MLNGGRRNHFMAVVVCDKVWQFLFLMYFMGIAAKGLQYIKRGSCGRGGAVFKVVFNFLFN